VDETDYATPEQIADAVRDLADECIDHRGATPPIVVTVLAGNGGNSTHLAEGESPVESISRRMSVLQSPPSSPSRLDQIGVEIRASYKRGVRDIAATKKLLIEARDLCRHERRSFDDLARSGFFGYGWRQVYYLIKGRRGGGCGASGKARAEGFASDLNIVQVSQRKEQEFLLTPFDKLAEIAELLGPDYFDACPFPRGDVDTLLLDEWPGRNIYVNMMFDDIGEFITKSIKQHQKFAKRILTVLPICAMGAIARLLCAGAVQWGEIDIPEWRSIKDGVSTNPAPPQSRQPCIWLVLDPEKRKRMRYYGAHPDGHTNWITPKRIFDGMGIRFDLDPASPGADRCHVPADRHFTRADNGLICSWEDLFVWLNPPFGRHRIFLWTRKFAEHGNGIILVPERTSTRWYQELAAKADLILEPNQKIPFLDSGLERQKGSFPIGTHLIAIGERGVTGLLNAHRAGLGLLVKPYIPAHELSSASQVGTR
jgi:hypothetical protein